MTSLRKSEWLEDWFVVDGAPFGQPEGTSAEWKAAIEAIKRKERYRDARRLGVRILPGGFGFYSPRNVTSEDDYVSLCAREVQEFIEQAEALLREYNHEVEKGEGI